MNLADQLEKIRVEVEQIRIEESISTSYEYGQDCLAKLRAVTEYLKEDKDEKLIALVTSLETLVSDYPIKQKPEKPTGFNFGVYKQLRQQGKIHKKIKELAEKEYGLTNIMTLRAFASCYARYYEKKPGLEIKGLPPEIIEKIKAGNYTAQDFLFDVHFHGVDEKQIKNVYQSSGMIKYFGPTKGAVKNKIKALERRMKETGQATIEIQNGEGNTYCIDTHGVIHLADTIKQKQQAAEANKGYD